MSPSSTLGLIAVGWLLGWSVAWPPGPINAEILRRATQRSFMSAASIGLGACTGDALWALAVALGAGVLLTVPWTTTALWIVSRVLLVALAALYLRGAWRGLVRYRGGDVSAPPGIDSARAGFALGFFMALSSPFNVAFWVGVLGRPELAGLGIEAALIMALAVVAGAASWVVALCALAGSLRAWLRHPLWDALTRAATALVLLAFAFL
jgi:threonine/homoserine/homoserine lactone efflux protein